MKRAIFWGAPLALLLGLVAWRLSTERADAQETATQAASRRNAPQAADLITAGPATLQTFIESVGTAESPFKVDISAKASGRIETLSLREGDPVRKGDIVAQLNPSDLGGQLLQQQAALAEARARLAEAQISKSANDISLEGGYSQQEANLLTAKAELEQAQQSYEAQIADAKSRVVDATSRVAAAESDVRNNQARVAAAKADADNAKQRYERFTKLLAEGYIAGQLVDDARANLTVAEKAVDVANAQLDGSRSALESAKANLNSANQQFAIAKNRASASVKTARARVDLAQSALRVAKANRSGTKAYEANLKALEASVRAAQAQVDQAAAKRQDMTLRSSIDGIVTARNADPGSLATPGQTLLTIQSLDWLLIEGSMPVEHASKVFAGQSVQLKFDGYPGRTWSGRITHINPAADRQTRQFRFQVRLENQDGSLRPGMFAQILIPLARVPVAIAIPKTALNEQGGKHTVRVVDEKGEVQVQDVVLGQSNEKIVEIKSGLTAGDKVVALSYSTLREGQKVGMGGEGKGKS